MLREVQENSIVCAYYFCATVFLVLILVSRKLYWVVPCANTVVVSSCCVLLLLYFCDLGALCFSVVVSGSVALPLTECLSLLCLCRLICSCVSGSVALPLSVCHSCALRGWSAAVMVVV